MKSKHYKRILVNAYKNQELTPEDFENTLEHFAKLYQAERQTPKNNSYEITTR